MASRSLLVTSLAVMLALGGCWGAQKSTPDNALGMGTLKPTVEDKDIGLVGIEKGFDVKRYKVIAVERFPVTDPSVKDDDDRRLAESMSAFFQAELVRRLRESGLFTRVVNLTETEYKPGPDALRMQGKITRLGKGSQAARAFAGIYGAGRTRAQADAAFLDANGRPMLVMADRRIAQAGFFGGDSKDHLKESFDDMARDVAKFLTRLSKGEAPRKD